MSDAPNTPDPVVPESPAGQEPTKSAESVKDLPDWAQKLIKDTNAEAASHRVAKTEAMANARTQVEAEFAQRLTESASTIQGLEDKLTVTSLELEKLRATVTAKVPSEAALEFASILQGTTPEEIKSHAEAAKKLFGAVEGRDRPVDPTQGTGNPIPLNGDPVLDALTRALKR
ncbi:hypothetical protein ACWCPQ_14595 [Nocardia sp. NPDC001965]